MNAVEKRILRRMVADLIASSGCGCCRDYEGWNRAEMKLALMLDVEKYDDDSGYDFYRYKSGGEADV